MSKPAKFHVLHLRVTEYIEKSKLDQKGQTNKCGDKTRQKKDLPSAATSGTAVDLESLSTTRDRDSVRATESDALDSQMKISTYTTTSGNKLTLITTPVPGVPSVDG